MGKTFTFYSHLKFEPVERFRIVRVLLLVGLFIPNINGWSHSIESNPTSFAVEGRILDENSVPLPGVSVLEKGTQNGVFTGADGSFKLNVADEGAILIFSFIGFKTLELPLQGVSTLEITLEPDISLLGEVVVVGYGSTSKGNVITAIGSVKSEQMNERPSTMNLVQGLAGRVAGVSVMSNSGKPGGNPSIKIRGTGSINSANAPLYVVDGIVGVDPLTIDPNIIESVDILKDASSSAIYGARGSNGVIVITTKAGKKGSTQISFSNTLSIGTLAKKVDVLDAQQSLEVYKRAYEYKPGRVSPHLDPLNVFGRKSDLFYPDGSPRYNTDWQEEATQTAVSSIHTLTVSGGSDNLTAAANLSYRNNEGIMLNSYRRQLNVFLNLGWKVSDRVNLKAMINTSGSDENNVDQGTTHMNATRSMLEFLPFMPVKYNDGTYSRKGDFPGAEQSENPVRLLTEMENIYGKMNTLAGISGTFQISDKLDFTANLNGQVGSDYQYYYAGGDLYDFGQAENGVATRQHINTGAWTNEDYLTYENEFGNHTITAVLGASWYYQAKAYTKAGSEGYYDDFFKYHNLQVGTVSQVPESGKEESQMNSYFARLNYNFNDRYLFGASFRADGSSRFGANNKFGYFPSFSAAWRISNEQFFDGLLGTISELKLRGSYGNVGNAEIGNYATLDQLRNEKVIFNGNQESAVVLSTLGNSDLKWETSTQLDVGLDAELSGGRVGLHLDLYDKKTNDLLYYRALPATSGYDGTFDNIGSIQNRGIELTLNTVNLERNTFTWTSMLVFSMNRSKVLDINDDIIYKWAGRIKEGEPLNQFYGYIREGTWSTEEEAEAALYNKKPGDIKHKDVNGNGMRDTEDRVVLGNGMPKWEGNFTNTFSYKGFILMADLQVMYGHDMANMTRQLLENRVTFSNSYTSVLDAWTPEDQDTDVASLRLPGDGYDNEVDSRTIEDASFLRIRNVSLSYRLNSDWASKLRMKSCVFGVNLENAAVFTKYAGYDPEATSFDGDFNQGVDFYQYPKPRTLSFNLTIGF